MSSLFIGDIQEDTLVFDRIYDQYHQVIYANIFKLIKSEAIAEDILQDVFFSLWENRMKIDIQKSVSGQSQPLWKLQRKMDCRPAL
jgi:RNA polymerase sigma-70 factor (ECF subfamily)